MIGTGQTWNVWQADLVLRDRHIWFKYQKAFCRLYGATYPLRGVDQARYDMFERKHHALERLTLTEGAVELQVGLSNSQVKVPP